MKTPSIKKNFIYSTFYQILSVITPFITAPYLSRVLGADGIGIQSYTGSIQAYFSMFAALGTLTYGAREISRARDDAYKRSKLFWEIELMTVFTSSICILIWIGLIVFSKVNRIYYIILTLSLISTMLDISWFFSGLEQFRLIVARNTFVKIAGVVCTFVFVRTRNDLWLAILINSGSMLLGNMSMWLYLKSYLKKIERKDIKILPHLKQTIIYFIPSIAVSVYTLLDKVLIGVITQDNAENGYYQQADKIITMVRTIGIVSIDSVVGVRISYLFNEKKYAEIHARTEYSMNFIFFITIGAMFGIIGVAKDFVPLFFGPNYDKVVTLLCLFALVPAINGVSHCLANHYYIPSGRRAQSSKYIIAGAIINLCMNIPLIMKLGAHGAVIATVISEIIISTLFVINSDGYLTGRMIVRFTWKKLIAGGAMLAVILLVSRFDIINSIVTLAVQVAAGGIVYLGMTLLLRDEWTVKFVMDNLGRILKSKRKT